MSKAFTRESDESGDEEVPAIRAQLPPGITNYITGAGAARLQKNLKALLERKQHGSLPEGDRRKLELGIRRLQQIIESVVVAERPLNQDKIAFGARAVVRHENGQEETYQIVGVEEADPDRGAISWLSPLARALLSRRAGEKVLFQFPTGKEELTVVSVRY